MPIKICPQSTSNPVPHVICGRSVGLIKKGRQSVFTELDAGISAHFYPIPAVIIDGVACDIRLRKPEDPNSIARVIRDSVAYDAGV